VELRDRGNLFGSRRFIVERELGRGGMGVVYQAFDCERHMSVAVKTLRHLDPSSLLRFKREFRAMADVSHRNLISLYELLSFEDQWLFTMELIQGTDFLSYVYAAAQERASTSEFPTHTVHTGSSTGRDDTNPTGNMRGSLPRRVITAGALDLDRLRSALAQLAEGLCALHDSRHLHCDLKPNNVLVTHAGRVVILDFGVVAELGTRRGMDGAQLVGTPVYMAPEIGERAAASPASDWYSVGIMLYTALTGCRPFYGDTNEIFRAKREHEPVPPGQIGIDLPEDLDRLCIDLLRIDPKARPTGAEVCGRLAGRAVPSVAAAEPMGGISVVGRERHLAALRDALARVRSGAAVTVYVHGESGMGKSALCEQFLAEVEDQALVFSGRCYERESVPYKAVDTVIDELSRYLLALAPEVARELLPEGTFMLARVFPVLQRVDAIAHELARSDAVVDPQELRRRAFAALRTLLGRIAATRPVILCIDDLQWGDIDSAALVDALRRPPDPPPVLFLGCYRSDEAARSPFLQVLRERDGARGGSGGTVDVVVGALAAEEAGALAGALLGAAGCDLGAAVTIVREAGGNPYFVHELVRYVATEGRVEGSVEGLTLDRVIAARVKMLVPRARKMLAAVAVAGRPVAQKVIERAVGLDPQERVVLLQRLRAAHLIRLGGVRDADPIEIYHDRIRESVAGSLGEEAARWHRVLAEALLAEGLGDAEALAEHWAGAGEAERAGHHAARAAEQAQAALAFDRAARLFARACALTQDVEAVRRLRAAQADALANAGRGPEAADAYLQAAAGAPAQDSLVWRRRAAEELMHSGHLDGGLTIMREVLAAVGLRLAPSPRRALVSLLWHRLRLRLRGTGFRERSTDQVKAADLVVVDILWSAATGLALNDIVRGTDMQSRHALRALAVGEPRRVARALAMECANSAIGGGRTRRRTEHLARQALAVAERLGEPQARGLATGTAGLGCLLRGEWAEARRRCAAAEAILRDHCTGVAWELATCQHFMLAAMSYLGDFAGLARLLPERLHRAEEKGDLYAATGLQTWPISMTWLGLDQPDDGRRRVDEVERRWSRRSFLLPHLHALTAQCEIDLFIGDGAGGLGRVDSAWQTISRSLLLRVENMRIEVHQLRARCALATGDDALLPQVVRDAAAMARPRRAWATPLAELVLATVAARQGDRASALRRLTLAEAGCLAGDRRAYAAVIRLRRGQLLGGDDGAVVAQEGERTLGELGAKNPSGIASVLAPGWVPRP
jgi:hypothetical protein